jgi:hypothetical protein
MSKTYELQLPVFKQGDDLGHQISEAKTLPEAFEAQASSYDLAAAMCRRMAAVVKEDPSLTVDACTHTIWLDGPKEKLDTLVEEGLLSVMDFGDDDEDEDWEEDAEDYEEDEDPSPIV